MDYTRQNMAVFGDSSAADEGAHTVGQEPAESHKRSLDGVVKGVLPESAGMLDKEVPSIPPHKMTYKFCGQNFCMRSFHRVTGVGRGMMVATMASVARGEVDYKRKVYHRPSFVMDSMHGALWCLISYCQERMPLTRARGDFVIMPMHHPVQLFNMLRLWFSDSLQGDGAPLLPCIPQYSTFRTVLKRPQFANVRFHRLVEMGRCPTFQLYNWRCMTCAAEHREGWVEEATRHQLLQLEQKRVYAQDRAAAALGYPYSGELYLAMDCSSGHEFVLPHMAAADIETQSKALKEATTNPLKVMNIIMHGDTRSHIVLSPSTVPSAIS